jgi:hypothetical protein
MDAGSFWSNNALYPRGLIVKRFLCGRRRVFGEEAIGVAGLYARWSADIAVTGMQACTRWNNRNVAGHHAGRAQLMLFHTVTPAFIAAAAKFFRRDAGNRAAHAGVGQRKIGVREKWPTSTCCERSDKTATSVIDHGNVGDVDDVNAIEAASVPGIKGISGTNRKPSDGTKAEAGTMSESDKEDKRRRP